MIGQEPSGTAKSVAADSTSVYRVVLVAFPNPLSELSYPPLPGLPSWAAALNFGGPQVRFILGPHKTALYSFHLIDRK